MAPFFGRWSDVKGLKVEQGRCAFCRHRRKVVRMSGLWDGAPRPFCGSCFYVILKTLWHSPEVVGFPSTKQTWDKWRDSRVN